MWEQAKLAYGDLARPSALYGLMVAIFLAIGLGRDAAVIGVLVGGVATIYSAKAVETAVVGKAQAQAGAQP